MSQPIVAIQHFIEAVRDSGYKSTSFAIAELVDNALEASADLVDVNVTTGSERSSQRITVIDDGTGMDPEAMQLALQFGGSTRFNSRRGMGRYGMGLPCSCLSLARRIDLYSWQKPTPCGGRLWILTPSHLEELYPSLSLLDPKRVWSRQPVILQVAPS